MRETGRKLTIRMPDSDRLTTAEVRSLHVEPGSRAAVGAPIMTLVARRREHVVRAPRPGRIVPLVGPGDRVRGGDPLYVLNLDEAALAQHNRDARALVAHEGDRWSSAADLEELQLHTRRRAAGDSLGKRLLAGWAGPVLAVLFYGVACFAFLPLLTAASADAGPGGRALLLAGALFLAVLIVRLYSPRFGTLPRAIVRLVAVAWVAIAALAVLQPADGPESLGSGGVRDRLVALLWPPERPPLGAEPVEPPVVESAGVYTGQPDGQPGAAVEPRSRLGRVAAPDPMAVTVRAWGRQNPSMRSGEMPVASADDAPPAAGSVADRLAAATPGPLGEAAPVGLPPPAAPERPEPEPAAPDGPEPVPAERLEPEPSATATLDIAAPDGSDDEEPLAIRAAADAMPPATDGAAPAAPADAPGPLTLASSDQSGPSGLPKGGGAAGNPADGALTSGAPGSAVAVTTAPADQTVVPTPGVTPAAPAADPGDAVAQAADAASGDRPAAVEADPVPDPVPDAVQLAGGPQQMSAAPEETPPQALASLDPLSSAAAQPGAPPAGDRPVAAPAGDRPVAAAAPAPGSAAPAAPPLPLPGGGGAAGPVLPDAPAAPPDTGEEPAVSVSALARDDAPAVAGAAPGALQAAAAPPPAPEAPDAGEAAAQRRLLFLYYDDPRLEEHPEVGDQWLPALAEETASAIRSARVEAVREVIEVAEWCSEGFPAALSDRIRLLQVRLEVEPAMLPGVEAELPVLAGAPPALFHNRAPLMGGDADAPLMELAREFLGVGGGGGDPSKARYFDSGAALQQALQAEGCRSIEWNGGEGPSNEIGRDLQRRFAG